MSLDYYKVMDKREVVADHMDLETALILVKALFQTYYRESSLELTIAKMREDGEE